MALLTKFSEYESIGIPVVGIYIIYAEAAENSGVNLLSYLMPSFGRDFCS